MKPIHALKQNFFTHLKYCMKCWRINHL